MTAQTPLFPFGHGLSYTTFAYDALDLSSAPQRVSVLVENTGARTGCDVVQVYVRAQDSGGVETWRLAGFKRVALAPGERRRVFVDLETRTFSTWDDSVKLWRTGPAPLRIAVGRSACNMTLEGELASG